FHHELLAMAQAAHNSGGIVIAQVESVVDYHETLQAIHVPGILVDYVVVSEQPGHHLMTFAEAYNEAYVRPWRGEAAEAAERAKEAEVLPDASAQLDARTIAQRRAVMELAARKPRVVNLGVGMPAAVGALAHQAGLGGFTLTV
ncbi:MAG TPA: acyl CoA:acetate/3-ketoacid CoA transferase, partial [Cupriavidus sp.]|nr:acyl CoA:acetate/3-ketoacid CoA transferase [Cupriavidus sp.]